MGIQTAESDDRTVELDDRGRVTVPVDLRDRLGIEPGHELAISLEEGRIVLTPRRPSLRTVSSDRDAWGEEAFPDSGEATFGGEP